MYFGLFFFKKSICALLSHKTHFLRMALVSTAKKEFSGNEPGEAVRRKWHSLKEKKKRPKWSLLLLSLGMSGATGDCRRLYTLENFA